MSESEMLSQSGCVVDASILVKLVLPEEGSEAAADLMAATASGDAPRRAAPELIYLQCTNIFWKRVRRGEISAELATTKLAQLLALPLAAWPSQRLVQPALILAIDLSLSVYDATYLALAQSLDVPLITADVSLRQKARAAGHDVRLLDKMSDSAGL
jgi:predicted nucleic acid-binding protein